jgi:hypothetical protein
MNREEKIEELMASGWKVFENFKKRGWTVFYKKNNDVFHYYFNPHGNDYLTVFKNGRSAEGYFRPND